MVQVLGDATVFRIKKGKVVVLASMEAVPQLVACDGASPPPQER